MTAIDLASLKERFYKQMPPVMRDIGGFFNPTVESDDGVTITFRCFYDNMDNENDSWYWYFNRDNGEFDN